MDREAWNKLRFSACLPPNRYHEVSHQRPSIGSLRLRNLFGVNITRVNRAGVDLIADSRLQLQLGDRVTVVGSEESIANVENSWETHSSG